LFFKNNLLFYWIKLQNEGELPIPMDSQTCAVIKDISYMFGGQVKKYLNFFLLSSLQKFLNYYQGKIDELFNDIFSFESLIDEENKSNSRAIWKSLETCGKMPPRSSDTCNTYRDEYLIIIGGEGISENSYFKLLKN
jgi:hypothetical protein